MVLKRLTRDQILVMTRIELGTTEALRLYLDAISPGGYLVEFLCSYTSLTDTQMPVEDFKDHTG